MSHFSLLNRNNKRLVNLVNRYNNRHADSRIHSTPELLERMTAADLFKNEYYILGKDGKNEMSDIRKKDVINQHFESDNCLNFTGDWIKRYCAFFDCDSDYLLGLQEQPKHEVTDVHNVTGLSEAAIQKLITCKSYNDSLQIVMSTMFDQLGYAAAGRKFFLNDATIDGLKISTINSLLEDDSFYDDILHKLARYQMLSLMFKANKNVSIDELKDLILQYPMESSIDYAFTQLTDGLTSVNESDMNAELFQISSSMNELIKRIYPYKSSKK